MRYECANNFLFVKRCVRRKQCLRICGLYRTRSILDEIDSNLRLHACTQDGLAKLDR